MGFRVKNIGILKISQTKEKYENDEKNENLFHIFLDYKNNTNVSPKLKIIEDEYRKQYNTPNVKNEHIIFDENLKLWKLRGEN